MVRYLPDSAMGNIDKNKYKYIFIFSIYKSILLFYLFYFFLSSLELLVIIIKCIFALEFYPKVKKYEANCSNPF